MGKKRKDSEAKQAVQPSAPKKLAQHAPNGKQSKFKPNHKKHDRKQRLVSVTQDYLGLLLTVDRKFLFNRIGTL